MGGTIQTAKQLINQGMIGEVTSVQAFLNRDMRSLYPVYRFTTLPGGGIGFDVGSYYLTAMLAILGAVKEVCVITATLHPTRIFEDPQMPEFGEPMQCRTKT